MSGTAAALWSPQRLVLWYLVLVIVGMILMMTSRGASSYEPDPVVGESTPPEVTTEDGDPGR